MTKQANEKGIERIAANLAELPQSTKAVWHANQEELRDAEQALAWRQLWQWGEKVRAWQAECQQVQTSEDTVATVRYMQMVSESLEQELEGIPLDGNIVGEWLAAQFSRLDPKAGAIIGQIATWIGREEWITIADRGWGLDLVTGCIWPKMVKGIFHEKKNGSEEPLKIQSEFYFIRFFVFLPII